MCPQWAILRHETAKNDDLCLEERIVSQSGGVAMGCDGVGRAWLLVAGLTGIAAYFAAGAARAQDERLPPEAVAVLERFLGEWETQTSLRRPGDAPREIRTRGQGTCRRTLEGRYFEFRTHTIPPGEAELQVMTFDPEAGVYRQWVFSSDGYLHEAAGTWDEGTCTLRWSGRTAAGAFVILDRFVAPGVLDWTLERRDAGGKVIQTIEGRLARVRND
jgi:hypothetical protein